MPEYDLDVVKAAAAAARVEYRGRKVQTDILNLGYELKDVVRCVLLLTPNHFDKSIPRDGGPTDDVYICEYQQEGYEERGPDRLYVKFCMFDDCLSIDIGSFHLAAF